MNSAHHGTIRKPFIEHIHELQKRLTWSLLALVIGSGVAYAFYEPLLAIVQKPLNQTLYYTSPTGEFSFLFKMCLAAGFVLALPIIIFHIFGFMGPLLQKRHRLSIVAYTMWSFNLAFAGLLFAYFISLPAALHFLATFSDSGLVSLIKADEYFSFALAYLAGFALLFQVPLIVLFVNRINRLKPGKMMGAQRYVILASFIVAAFLTPTPDPFNQFLMAAPAIVLYQVGIVMVMLVNRKKRFTKKPRQFVAQQESNISVNTPVTAASPAPVLAETNAQPLRRMSRKYIDIIPPSQHQVRRQESHEPETASAF